MHLNTAHPSAEPPTDPPIDYCKTATGQWIKVVRSMIRGLSHGEVQLTVKDGEVVEVRKLEKIRFERRPPVSRAGVKIGS